MIIWHGLVIAVVAIMMNACRKQTLDRLSDLGLHDQVLGHVLGRH